MITPACDLLPLFKWKLTGGSQRGCLQTKWALRSPAGLRSLAPGHSLISPIIRDKEKAEPEARKEMSQCLMGHQTEGREKISPFMCLNSVRTWLRLQYSFVFSLSRSFFFFLRENNKYSLELCWV